MWASDVLAARTQARLDTAHFQVPRYSGMCPQAKPVTLKLFLKTLSRKSLTSASHAML